MKIPKNVLIVGTVSTITYQPTKSKRAEFIDYDGMRETYFLATNKTHTELYIIEDVRTGKNSSVEDKRGIVKGYIHQAIELDVPKLTLKKIGKILSIRYRSVWWEGTLTEYRHDFKGNDFFADRYSRFKTMGIKAVRGKILNKNGITG